MKNALVDTHVLLWYLMDDSRISENIIEDYIENEKSVLYISSFSFFEIAIKNSIGKLEQNVRVEICYEAAEKMGIRMVGPDRDIFEILQSLPFIHKDPFDRILVATAMSRSLPIITNDKNIAAYAVRTAW
ncbi:MAG: type II toxin-antitoxin system VapC family toxin [Clostridiales Family XIII bacterium]|nr:type II toxin-antitoxin system VapC family toxin [Clostridiales Family XIII bacterium]